MYVLRMFVNILKFFTFIRKLYQLVLQKVVT